MMTDGDGCEHVKAKACCEIHPSSFCTLKVWTGGWACVDNNPPVEVGWEGEDSSEGEEGEDR